MSSLIFLGFSVVAFIISFGVVFMLAPIILGQFFGILDAMDPLCCGWETTKDDIQAQAQWLLPLMMVLGMFILILKVFMIASVRGRD